MRRLLADEVSFNSVISVCEQCCQWQIALDVFSTMMTSMLLPNLITFNSTISACSKASQPSKALALIHAMREQHLRADIISYNSIITADIEQMNGWQRSCQMLDDLTPGMPQRKLKMWMSLAPQEREIEGRRLVGRWCMDSSYRPCEFMDLCTSEAGWISFTPWCTPPKNTSHVRVQKKTLVKNVSVQHWFRKTWQGRSRPRHSSFKWSSNFKTRWCLVVGFST